MISSPHNLDEFIFKAGIFPLVKNLKKRNINLAIVSNQPDVARGLLSLKNLEKMNNLIKKKLGIEHIFVCKHDSIDSCDCRKPKPGLLLLAKKILNFSIDETVFVGDGWKDMEAGKIFGVKTILLRTKYNRDVDADIEVDKLSDIDTFLFKRTY